MQAKLRTHCPQGHEYNVENTLFYKTTRLCKQCRAARKKKYAEKYSQTQKGRIVARRSVANSRARFPEKIKARKAVFGALRHHHMVRPNNCETCGAKAETGRNGRSLLQAHHHKGYDHPLDVIWECLKCHRKEHSQAA